jgi:hypothetical protein
MNWDDLVAIHAALPEPQPVFYRLYYDDSGVPLFYSMEDLPGNYLELTQEQYAQNKSNIRVRNGEIVELTWVTSSKLVPGTTGTPCDPRDVAVVTNLDSATQWSKRTYEQS